MTQKSRNQDERLQRSFPYLPRVPDAECRTACYEACDSSEFFKRLAAGSLCALVKPVVVLGNERFAKAIAIPKFL